MKALKLELKNFAGGCVMEEHYKSETFSADGDSFDREFSNFLNSKWNESWNVESCSYCHDDMAKKTYASCIFKKR
jgi:hypothetical protein